VGTGASGLLPGYEIGGKYRIDRELDRGGMAVVYLARQRVLNREVAVKVIDARLAQHDAESFLEEAAKVASLGKSRFIVDVLDADVDPTSGLPYVVMERLVGESLSRYVEARGAMPPELVAVVMRQLGEALDQAHEKSVVHRDVKPSNLFLTYEGREPVVKLLDFGIAKVVTGGAKHTATQTGTLAYAAPEQLGSAWRAMAAKQGVVIAQGVSPQTDVWAMGLVAYELLTGLGGGQLWGTSTASELPLIVALQGVPNAQERAGAQAGRLPVGFDAWLARCLEKESSRRWASAGEAAGALLACLAPRGAAASAAPAPGAVETRVAFETFAPPVGAHVVPSQQASLPVTPAASYAPTPPPSLPPRARPASRVSAGAALVIAGLTGIVGLVAWRAWSSRKPDVEAPAPTATASAVVPPVAPPVLREPTCPEGMVLIPKGTFQMGSDDGGRDEKPVHPVTLEAYCLDRTEVTVAAYAACSACGAAPTSVASTGYSAEDVKFWSQFCNGNKPDRQEHPINCVDATQADAYCAAVGKRLPTEEEWEYAARGPNGNKYPWGDAAPGPTLLNACGGECKAMGARLGKSWVVMYEGNDGWESTAPVGSYPAGKSPFGLLDMAGNVWEWTSSGYSENYDKTRGEARVFRGGGWDDVVASWVRGAVRYRSAPSRRDFNLGFRCARALLP
jgi:formylglycine-generating enzyme required for sulfatase activity